MALNLRFTERITAHSQTTYTEASGSLSGLSLDPTQVSAIPPGFDYVALSELGDYSRLRIRWWGLEAGMRQMLGGQVMLEYALTYQNYKDIQPYLVDKTGKNLGFVLRLHRLF
jgi:hypothetical protein